MNKVFLLLLIGLLFVTASTIAVENDPIPDWRNADGVTLQPKQRLKQIKAYQKKLQDAETKKLQEGREQDGVTVQSQERVRKLNEMEKKRREKEIRELKCTMCNLRCTIIRDAEQTTCTGSGTFPAAKLCGEKAGSFLKSCLQQCDSCLNPDTAD